jgi:hypothetical protein
MSFRRASLSVALLCLGLSSACALRPRYGDVVVRQDVERAAQAPALTLRLLNKDTNRPIPGAHVVASSGRNRVSVFSDAEGLVSLPVTQALADENPLLEVVLPKGVAHYRFEAVVPEAAPAPEAPAEAPAQAAPPAEAAPGTSN